MNDSIVCSLIWIKIYLFYKVIDQFDYAKASRFTKSQRLCLLLPTSNVIP